MIPAGERDRKIAFHAIVVTEDGLGTETEAVASDPVAQAFAKVLFGTGQERRDAAAAGAVQSATFRVLSTAAIRTVTERHIIRGLDADWGIVSISPVGPQGAEIEFTATKLGAAGWKRWSRWWR